MAKKSFVLSNDDGRVSFSITSSVSIDDGITTGIAGAISASQLYVTTLTASSLGVSNGTGSFLSASSTGILARSTLTGSFSSGALGWNGTAIVATNVIPGDYSGSSAINTDISGNYSDDIKVVGIGNVFSGSLPVAFGGTGLTGSQYAASNRLILKVSGSTAPVISTLSASASGTIIASGEGRFHVQPPSYQPDVRFYNTPGTHTWTRPIGARFARVILQGAGGGGGGSWSASGNGGGGGSGAFTDLIVDVSALSSGVIVVGLGGTGGNTGVSSNGTGGGQTSFAAPGLTTITAGGGGGGTGATSPTDNTNPGGAAGAAMTGIVAGGYSKAGVAGANALGSGTAGVPFNTAYGVPGGGGAGGWYNRSAVVQFIASPNFGYSLQTAGDNSVLQSLQFFSGSEGVAGKANLGAGGGAVVASLAKPAGSVTKSDNGGDGYALIISW